MRALWRDRFYHVGRHSMPSGPLGEPPWSWVEAILGFRKTAVGFVASAVCRHTLAGIVRVDGLRSELLQNAIVYASCRGPPERNRESGVETAPEGGTKCPSNDYPALNVWNVF